MCSDYLYSSISYVGNNAHIKFAARSRCGTAGRCPGSSTSNLRDLMFCVPSVMRSYRLLGWNATSCRYARTSDTPSTISKNFPAALKCRPPKKIQAALRALQKAMTTIETILLRSVSTSSNEDARVHTGVRECL
jgi:hypothetical protein